LVIPPLAEAAAQINDRHDHAAEVSICIVAPDAASQKRGPPWDGTRVIH
jgi:hypothetical protein